MIFIHLKATTGAELILVDTFFEKPSQANEHSPTTTLCDALAPNHHGSTSLPIAMQRGAESAHSEFVQTGCMN